MREVADRRRIDAFLAGLARAVPAATEVFLVGGSSAVVVGWRATTVDIDMAVRPESDALLRAIPALKEQLQLNVELASPDQFLPIPAGWERRSPFVAQIGRLSVRHFDFAAQALAKIERGHARDLDDVRAMLRLGLITETVVREQFAGMEDSLYKFPAISPASFRRAIDAVFAQTR
jgi:hypothetical protein